MAVKLYGGKTLLETHYFDANGTVEAEFWLSGGKLLLIFLLFSFTFVSMCGGNPKGDAYGFR